MTLKQERSSLLEADESRIAPPAVLRRSDGTSFSSRSDDEVGGLQRRDPRRTSLASEAIKTARFALSELGERSNPIGSRAAVLDERGGSRVSGGVHAWQCCWLRVSEEGSGLPVRSAPSELGERGNQR